MPRAVAFPLALLLLSCRSPTQVTVVVTTDFACTDLRHTTITVGELGDDFERNRPPTSTSSICVEGRVGSLVVIPSGSNSAEIGIKIVGGFATKDADACVPSADTPPRYGSGCIVARRALRFIAHTPLTLPVVLYKACEGIACKVTETCEKGQCVPARIEDPSACAGDPGCTLPSTDAGSPDSPSPTPGWIPMSPASSLGFAARDSHVAVWTGTKMLVWGGVKQGAIEANDGAAYDPTSDKWSAMKATPLAARKNHSAVWTGSAMIVWGGDTTPSVAHADGMRYEPASDAWTPIAASPLAARTLHVAVWSTATNEMIVWGGADFSPTVFVDGAAYDPAANTWRSIAASPLAKRTAASAVWAGDRMVVFGGAGCGGYCNDAASYDPKSDKWSSVVAAPIDGRKTATSAATGPSQSRSTFWGGDREAFGEVRGDGANLDPMTMTWQVMPAVPTSVLASAPRSYLVAWWDSARFNVWGGTTFATPKVLYADGASFDPATNTWSALPASGLAPRFSASVVWTGTRAIIWGGGNPSKKLDDGMMYSP